MILIVGTFTCITRIIVYLTRSCFYEVLIIAVHCNLKTSQKKTCLSRKISRIYFYLRLKGGEKNHSEGRVFRKKKKRKNLISLIIKILIDINSNNNNKKKNNKNNNGIATVQT